MKRINKMALAAIAATALAASAQAQYNAGDLLLGFTSPNSGQASQGGNAGYLGDLIIDLGTGALIGVGSGGSVNLNDNGNVGYTAAGLQLELTSLFGGMGGLSFGVVGGKYVNASSGFTFGTVAHGATPPIIANVGALKSSAALAGTAIGDGSANANSAIVDPNAAYGYSWQEAVVGTANGQWSHSGSNPDSTTPATFTSGSVMEDLYEYNLAGGGAESLVGTIARPSLMAT